ncbi:TlyA family rRNA (cytidine-2'-O)-methyltransferase [Candidatus Saccharibacteria bacterium]|nr:TlyA family rRNA (cytidine-2'-O)-methyltransferase [Candidatus Saccharibacteria bacterium]
MNTRGKDKILGALTKLRVDFKGKTVIDIGSSTGGFTEVALKCGAKKVIAVEKGTGQMVAPLRYDERVELHEKTDIFKFRSREKIEVIMADVSFVSLTKVLAYAKMHIARSDTDFLVMCKPQFEAKPWQLEKGVVKNNKIRRDILREFEGWLGKEHFLVLGKHDNETAGRHGNVERFYWLKLEQK